MPSSVISTSDNLPTRIRGEGGDIAQQGRYQRLRHGFVAKIDPRALALGTTLIYATTGRPRTGDVYRRRRGRKQRQRCMWQATPRHAHAEVFFAKLNISQLRPSANNQSVTAGPGTGVNIA